MENKIRRKEQRVIGLDGVQDTGDRESKEVEKVIDNDEEET